jgi:VIT1/CCC1 family predicted Fe2+/Mn2+ transporter
VWAFTFDQPTEGLFFWSSLFTSVAFVIIGFLKSWVNRRSRLRCIIETVLLGGIAACVAYFVGKWLEAFV